MANIITQAQYNTSQQTIRNTYLKINLLNFDYLTVDSLEGSVVTGSIQINSDSDIRRTCDISIVVTNSSFDVAPGGKIWLDKLIQIYVGVVPSDKKDIEWTNLGIYLINQPSYQYDATTHTLTFQGVDLMAKLTGLRYGYLSGVTYKVPVGSNVKDVIISVLKENGFNKYVVSECYNDNGDIQEVPYDMEYEMGSSWYDILSGLRDILPNYQIYFDVDGVFHYETIPYTDNEPIMIDDNVWNENVLSENINVDFESIKNSIEVYGKTHDINNYPSDIVVEGSNIKLTIGTIVKLEEYTMIGFMLKQDVTGFITIQVNDFPMSDLVDAYGYQIFDLAKDEYWVARYTSDGKWEFLGHQQASGAYKDENPESPFYVENQSGEIKLVLYGGNYEHIYSDDLAEQRAKFEIYQRCRLNDAVEITCVPIYWADVNWMVNYTPLDTTEEKQYMIKSINTDLTYNGTQSIHMISYYPYYEASRKAKAYENIRILSSVSADYRIFETGVLNGKMTIKHLADGEEINFIDFSAGNILKITSVIAADSSTLENVSYKENINIKDSADGQAVIVDKVSREQFINIINNILNGVPLTLEPIKYTEAIEISQSIPKSDAVNLEPTEYNEEINFKFSVPNADNVNLIPFEQSGNVDFSESSAGEYSDCVGGNTSGIINITCKGLSEDTYVENNNVNHVVDIKHNIITTVLEYITPNIQSIMDFKCLCAAEAYKEEPEKTRVGMFIEGSLEELTEADFGNLTTLPEGTLSYMVGYDKNADSVVVDNKLSKIYIPNTITAIGDNSFIESSYNYLSMSNSVSNMYTNWFLFSMGNAILDCTKYTSVPTLTKGSAEKMAVSKIIVPESLLSSWKSATNWSAMADIIVSE